AGTVPNNSITSVKIAAGQVVKSLNGIRDAVTMRAQGGATITSSGDTIVINAGSGGGGTGVQSIQNTNNTFDIMNPTGPTVTTNLKVPLSLSANVDTANSAIITASNTAATNLVHGVIGRTSSSTADAAGVLGEALATTGGTTGVIGRGTASSNGTGVAGFGGTRGVYGTATASSGSIYGVRGVATSSSQGTGVYGEGTLYGVAGASPSASGVGVNGTGGLYGGTFTGGTYGVQANGPYVGVLGMTLSTLSGSQGVRGVAAGSSGLIYGVQGITNSTTFLSSGVRGEATASSGQTIGVEGVSYASPIGTGVSGRGGAVGGYFEAFSSSGTGVYGFGSTGIYGQSFTAGGTGVQGVIEHNITVSSWGVWGRTSAPGQAGHFSGNVEVAGNLSKTTGSFKIDHPLDPANKYLYHSFVESPDMMNIYNGNVELDGNGEAVVTLPAWFEALNKEFRYQLTCIGGFAPVYVAEEVRRNQFKIAGGKVGMKVSWQVTGIRHDAYAEKHPIPVEEEKPHIEKGHYLHPDVFNQPEERSIEWAVRPEAMRRLKEMRENPKRSEIPSLPTTPQAKEQW
ncbi:MAG TPA: hypothetical protein VFG32_06115, partial [Bacteroidota bacterium]|nr:hypothetical protein [Bacteroidota bacterium]